MIFPSVQALLLLGLLGQITTAKRSPSPAVDRVNVFSNPVANPTIAPTPVPPSYNVTSAFSIGVASGSKTYGYSAAVDNSGDSIIGGSTTGQIGSTSNLGGQDFFVQSYSSAGILQLTAQFGTSLDDRLYDVSTDSSGNIYSVGMCGFMSSDPNNPAPSTFYGTPTNGAGDVCYAVLNPSGNKLLSGVVGGAKADAGTSIVVQGSSFYIAGWTTNNPFDGVATPSSNPGFVLKYDIASGTQLSHYQPDVSQPSNAILSMAIDGLGNIWTIAGYGISGMSPATFLINKISPGMQSLLWINEVPSTSAYANEMIAQSIATDGSNNVYAAGYTLLATVDGQTNNGNSDVLVFKYSNAGDKLWTALVGGTSRDQACGIATDNLHNVIYVTGFTYSTSMCGFTNPQTNPSYSTEFLMVLDMNSGACQTVKYYLPNNAGPPVGSASGSAAAVTGNVLALAGYSDNGIYNVPGYGNMGATLLLLNAGNLAPSSQPTAAPTSHAPTVTPSAKPSLSPSARPSTAPTRMPSLSPSMCPTVSPSAVPTAKPSTTKPTVVPSAVPTAKPSTTVPTARPTNVPTFGPSAAPTANPTIVPTSTPSDAPTLAPTIEPTEDPTVSPTDAPTAPPTLSPSLKPSARPSVLPTCKPSAQPTALPTLKPSVAPTALPSMTPTVAPSTALPSAVPTRPTAAPTVPPTINPTALPSTKPSRIPTIQPTAVPTAPPSARPTRTPTVQPSAPTMIPTIKPTARPVNNPTAKPSNPSAFPTFRPTAVPSAYVVPWVQTSAGAYSWVTVASDSSGQFLVAAETTTYGVWTSTDFGTTWAKRVTLPESYTFEVSSDASGQNLVITTRTSTNVGSAYFSRDYGLTWTLSDAPSLFWTGLACDASGQQVIINANVAASAMYISHNFGQNWTITSAPKINWVSVASSASGQYLAAGSAYSGMYTSKDYGATWVVSPNTAKYWVSIASDATGQYLVASEYNSFAYTSTDYGSTFVSTQQRVGSSVCSDSSGANLAASGDATSINNIILSSNFGASWAVSASPILGWTGVASDASGKRLVAVSNFKTLGIWTYNNTYTAVPSSAPTSVMPSIAPTARPSLALTASPSTKPSRAPTVQPTAPTRIPTRLPTARPSRNPTTGPSNPSIAPSIKPTAVPTVYVVPWVLVNAAPTAWASVASDATGQYLVAIQSGNTYAVWTSTDYGVTWLMRWTLVDTLYQVSVCSDSSGQNLVLSSWGLIPQVFYSRDYGITWTLSDAPSASWYGLVSDASGQQVVISASYGPIYISHNFGQNWTLTSAPTGNRWVSVASSASGQFLAACAYVSSVYTSNDYGVTWQKTSMPNGLWRVIASDATGQYLVVAGGEQSASLYTSSDYGATFVNRNIKATVVCSDSSGANLAALNTFVNPARILISADYGATWAVSAAPAATWTDVACDASGDRLVAVGNQAGIWTYYNTFLPVSPSLPPTVAPTNPTAAPTFRPTAVPTTSVIPWSQASVPTNPWSSVASDVTGQYLVASESSTPSIWRSTDYGATWIKQYTLPYGTYKVTSDNSGQNLVAMQPYGTGSILFSRNYGLNWTSSDSPSRIDWEGLACDASGQQVIACHKGGLIYISVNYGQNWKSSPSAPTGAWTCVASSASGQFLVGGMSGAGIYTSGDYGSTWVLTPGTTQLWTSVASDSSGQYLAAGVSNGNVYTSSDYGATFVKRQIMGSIVCSDSSGANLAAFLLTGASGSQILLSNDYGATWTVSAAPTPLWAALAFDGSGTRLVAVASQYTAGIWTYRTNSTSPTVSPTLAPTKIPGAPTESPTNMPTVKPSSSAPTIILTIEPTARPESAPTAKPSNPSALPTLTPTAVPTMYVVPWVQTSAGAYSWVAVASDSSGQFLVAVETTTYGVWTSTDFGTTWAKRATFFGDYFQVCSDASGQNLVLTARTSTTVGSAYFSRDYGLTWTLSDAPNYLWYAIASDASGQQVIMNVNNNAGAMYISHNFGQNWAITSAPAKNWLSVASSASGQYLVAGSAYTGMFTSNDYGVTWVLAPNTANIYWISVASDATGQYLVASGYTSYAYTSTDYGATFVITQQTVGSSVCSDSSGANLAGSSEAFTSNNIILSSNFGATWAVSSSPILEWSDIASDASGKRLVAVASQDSAGGIWIYYNNNFTNASVSPSLAPTTTPGAPTANPTIMLSSMPSSSAPTRLPTSNPTCKPTTVPTSTPTLAPTVMPTTSNSASNNPVCSPTLQPTAVPTVSVVPWVQVANTDAWDSIASDATGQYLVAAEQTTNAVWTSTDYGSNWVRRFALSPGVYKVSSDSSGQNLVVAMQSGPTYFSRDFGMTWTLSDAPLGFWVGLASDASGQQVIITSYATSGPIYISHNFGQNWTLTSAPGGYWTSAASSASGQFLVASISGMGIYTRSDYGATWVAMAGTARFWNSVACDATGQYIIAGESQGNVFTSSDYGVTFVNRQVVGSYVCSDSSGANLAAFPLTGTYGTSIILSADYGATWVVSAAPSTVWRAVASDASGKRLAAAASQLQPGIWTYNNDSSNSSTPAPTKTPTTTPGARNPTKMPTKVPTKMPTKVPTKMPTENPTIMPTIKPSSSTPTFFPTLDPTSKPTTVPTWTPTLAPTIVPTTMPTSVRTASPSMNPAAPTMVPTIMPSAPPSPIVSFSSNITLSGLVTPTLDAASQSAVVETTAAQMGVPVSTVSYVTTIALPTVVAPATHLRNGARRVQTTYAVIAVTETQVALDQTSYATTADLFSGLTTNLVNSVNSGAYSAALVNNAQAMGATDLYTATATDATSSEPTVTSADAPSNGGGSDTLSVGIIVGIALGGAALLALCGVLFVCYRQRSATPSAQESSTTVRAFAINDTPMQVNPLSAKHNLQAMAVNETL